MIKRYLQFIKEQKSSENASFLSNWPLTDDKYEELFIDMIDSGFTISTENGFIDILGGEDSFQFIREADLDNEMVPCKRIMVYDPKGRKIENDDLTDSFQSSIEYIKSMDFNVILRDDDGVLDGDSIKVENYVSIDDGDDGLDLDGDLQILVYNGDVKVKPRELDLIEYYNWKVDEIIGENFYIYITQENLADHLLSRNDSYKKSLINGVDYDRYDNSYFRPEVDDLFRYYLDTENSKAVIKLLVDEIGGLESVNEQYDLGYETYEDLEEFLLKERYYSTLKEICDNSELDLVRDIETNYSDLYLVAMCSESEKSIEEAFDKIVDDELDGNIKDRDDSGVFYKIKFNRYWVDDTDYEELKDKNLADIFDEYAGQEYWNNTIKPYFNDYASIDNKEFNADVKHTLKWYQKKDTE